jgi:hypothetical protein
MLLPHPWPENAAVEFQGLWADHKERPASPEPLLLLADWCEDHGCLLDALLWRWCAREGARPGFRDRHEISGRKIPAAYAWAWYRHTAISDEEGAERCAATLPRLVFLALPAAGLWDYRTHCYYPSEDHALADLRSALADLLALVTI